MRKVCGPRTALEHQLFARGATLESIAPAILSREADQICVDIDHPAYPRPAPNERGKPIPLPCLHRGDVIDRVRCPTCTGVVFAKIHACVVHERCTLFTKAIAGARACSECSDLRARC